MPDVESVLVGNLTESLRRADRYLVLGLLSAMLLAVYTFLATTSEGISLAPGTRGPSAAGDPGR